MPLQTRRNAMLVAAMVSGLGLAACHRPALKAEPTHIESAAAGAAAASIHGFASCAGCGDGARGARLDVQVIDAADTASPPLIAEGGIDPARAQRMAFSVAIDAQWISAGRSIALRATLRDATGHLLATTARKVGVTTSSKTPVELVLLPVSVR